ncbi:MAG: outer membrane protein assembly factor BamD [Deltaproteobacteria bacterium]|nr:outer membrane protein assembly factor BamD [Deltaproteobacteria bacterium]
MEPEEINPSRRSWSSLLLLAGIFLLSSGALAEDRSPGLYIDENLQMNLGDYFFKDADYYRAVTEYKRFLFLFPQSSRTEEVLWKITQSYFHGRKWDEANLAADEVLKGFPESARKAEVFLLKGFIFREKKEYSRSRTFFQKAVETTGSRLLRDEAHKQIALTYLQEDNWPEAAKAFREIDPLSPLYPRSDFFARGLEHAGEVPQKSPAIAGSLAAVLPGAGHVYVNRYRDALVAFLLNGAFIWGMVESFEHKNYVVGGILTFFELGWYSGNVYSAISSAHKYNQQQKKEYLEHLEKESQLSVGISFQEKSPLLCFHYRF